MEGKKCLELYTNPKFFLDEWIAEQIKQQQQTVKEERRKRRADKAKQGQDEPKACNQLGAAQPKRLVKDVFDPVTGQKMSVQAQPTDSNSEFKSQNFIAAQSTMRKPGNPPVPTKEIPQTPVKQNSSATVVFAPEVTVAVALGGINDARDNNFVGYLACPLSAKPRFLPSCNGCTTCKS